jgi:hypothetical protein
MPYVPQLKEWKCAYGCKLPFLGTPMRFRVLGMYQYKILPQNFEFLGQFWISVIWVLDQFGGLG